MSLKIGIDVGGTFTDFLVADENSATDRQGQDCPRRCQHRWRPHLGASRASSAGAAALSDAVRYRWNWDGGEAMLMSRAVDETGEVQITLEAAHAAREANKDISHWKTNIRAWAVRADGSVVFGLS